MGIRAEPVPLDAATLHEHSTTKSNNLKKGVIRNYGLMLRTDASQRKKLWSVLTGSWVSEHLLKTTTFYPVSLGPQLERELLNGSTRLDPRNALLLPEHFSQAVYDWAVVLVTGGLDADRRISYKVKILDPENRSLKAPLYRRQDAQHLTGIDVDDRELVFNTDERPLVSRVYFHSCCAVWKKVCLENPHIEDREAFWNKFLENMIALWGEKQVMKKLNKVTEIFHPRDTSRDDE